MTGTHQSPEALVNSREKVLRTALHSACVNAALAVAPYRGRGANYGKDLDGVASEAIRCCLANELHFSGRAVIGEGLKDGSHGIFYGERLGPEDGEELFHLAVDPVEGTTKTYKFQGGAMSIMAAALNGYGCLFGGRWHYGDKLVLGKDVATAIKSGGKHATKYGVLDVQYPLLMQPLDRVVSFVAEVSGKQTNNLHVVCLERSRNEEKIAVLRRLGVQLELIDSGDVAAAWSVLAEEHPVDMTLGIGGGPEAVLTAGMARCYQGYVEVMPWFEPTEKGRANRVEVIEAGQDPKKLFRTEDLAGGRVVFALTAITDGILPGIRYVGNGGAKSYSVIGRSAAGSWYELTGNHPSPPQGPDFSED